MSDTENSSAGVSLPEEPPSSRSPSPTTANKRKRDAASEPAVEETVRRKKKRKTWAAEDGDLDVQSGINNAIGRMDGRLLADYVAQRTKRFGGDLSLVELEDRHIPGEQNVTPDILGALHSLPVKYLPLGSNAEKAFLDTSSWAKPRELSSLPEFLEHYSTTPGKAKNLSSSSKLKGAPHTIVVTGAGLRAADLTRALRTFQTKDATVAKLFAKHIKLKDAVQFVKSTRTGIAVGTPTRLTDLLDNGALSLEKLERIVVDASHIDQKKRGILDMKETQIPLMQFLNRKGLKDRYGTTSQGVDLLFY